MSIDQQAVAINFNRRLTVGRDINGVNAGFGLINAQAIGTAVHDAKRGVRAGAKGSDLAGESFGRGGEISQAQECAFHLALSVSTVNCMFDPVLIRAAFTVQLQVQCLGPVAQATAGFKAIAAAKLFLLTTGDVQLVAYD